MFFAQLISVKHTELFITLGKKMADQVFYNAFERNRGVTHLTDQMNKVKW